MIKTSKMYLVVAVIVIVFLAIAGISFSGNICPSMSGGICDDDGGSTIHDDDIVDIVLPTI